MEPEGALRSKQYIDAFKDMHDTYIPLATASGSPPDFSLFSSFAELQNIKPALARAGITPCRISPSGSCMSRS